MAKDSVFNIDGKEFPLESHEQQVSTLLDLVGTSCDESVLVSMDGIKYTDPDQVISIVPGAYFTIEKRDPDRKPRDKPIEYSVNGELCKTVENPISVETILRNAGAGAAIDLNDLKNYFLENTEDGRKYENLDDLVTISFGDKFLAIHVGSTPVA